jgi:GTPase
MRTGETAIVEFRFLYRPEFVLEGETIFFRDGLTKGVGEVLSVIKE